MSRVSLLPLRPCWPWPAWSEPLHVRFWCPLVAPLAHAGHERGRPAQGWTVPADGQLDGQLAPRASMAAVLMQACSCCLTALVCFQAACARAWQALGRLQVACCMLVTDGAKQGAATAVLASLRVRGNACRGCGLLDIARTTHADTCGTLAYARLTTLRVNVKLSHPCIRQGRYL